jgi:hypothetical protein
MLQIQAENDLKAAALNRAIQTREAIQATLQLAEALYSAGQIGLDKVLTYRLELQKAVGAANAAQQEFNQTKTLGALRGRTAGVNLQAAEVQASGNFAQALANVSRTGGFGQPRYYIETPDGRIPQFAKGGYVTRPTLAVIGEGGEPEYVVPRSKAKSFAAAVSSGVSGEQAIASRRPSWREIALETLANDPMNFTTAANAVKAGWRKQGMKWGSAQDDIMHRKALESLGFKVARSVHWGAGGTSIKGHPSLSNIRRELEALRNRRQGGSSSSGGAGITLNTRIDRVIRQDGEDRVTIAQAQALASDAARQAVAQMDRRITSPSYRQSRGLRG